MICYDVCDLSAFHEHQPYDPLNCMSRPTVGAALSLTPPALSDTFGIVDATSNKCLTSNKKLLI